MFGNVFFELLRDVCDELQISKCHKIDACPIVVSSNFILQFKDIIIKIYTEKVLNVICNLIFIND